MAGEWRVQPAAISTDCNSHNVYAIFERAVASW